MEGNREEGLRKGPWKAEEDEVLVNHVSKYGPRDWSSIRSKGLLQRTGKSCRLRWVNKLRPNLKNGCKFSLEEERVVIELQSEFGNKWARIATYLPGRTDNDVKNFWSSRQKRLARILQTSQTTTSSSSSAASRPPRNYKRSQVLLPGSHDPPPIFSEAGVFTSSSEGESPSKMLSCSPSNLVAPDLFKPRLVSFEQDLCRSRGGDEEVPRDDSQPPPPVPFPPDMQPPPPPQQQQPDLAFSADILAGFDPYYDVFGPLDGSKLGNVEAEFSLGRPDFGDDSAMTPDFFFDDFPVDMFDQIEPLRSPSEL